MAEVIETKSEMFELDNHSKVTGYRIACSPKIGFDCFLYKPKDTFEDRWILYDEMSGAILSYVQQDLLVSLEKVKQYLRKKSDFDTIIQIHNSFIENGNILPKFSKDIKIKFFYDTKKLAQFAKKEHLDEFVKITGLNHYFSNIYCHDTGNGNNDYIQNDSCYIYCAGLLAPKGIKQEERMITINEDDIPFIDVLDYPGVKIKGNVSRTITFFTMCYGNKYILAHYIYDMNTLLLPDISHSNDFRWVIGFIDFLKMSILTKKVGYIPDKYVLTMGSDPEFELHRNGKNTVCQELSTGNRLRSKIGSDGSGRQMELRPAPKTNPEDAVKELGDIIDSISYHTIRCDGDQEPLGAHIHFGITKNGVAGRLRPCGDIIKILDLFLGKHMIKYSGAARSRHGYGKLGDFREQPWGFEYRSLPSAIFFNKDIAYICYKIAFNIVNHIVENGSLECGINPGLEDYRKFAKLTESEYEYFINFDKVYNNKTKEHSISDNWTTKKEYPLKLKFFDKWNDDVKEYFRKELEFCIVTKPITLCLYGINENKGTKALAGMYDTYRNINGACNIPHPKDSHCDEGISIGLGLHYRIRITNDLDYIILGIRNKIGIANESIEEINTFNLFPEEMLNRSPNPNVNIGTIRGNRLQDPGYEVAEHEEH